MALGRPLLALLLLCGASPTRAQEPSTAGLTLGAGVAPGWLHAGDDVGWGPAGSARVAFGFSRVVQLFGQARYGTADTDGFEIGGSWRLWSLEAGLRLHLVRAPRAWAPYLDVAIARRTGSIEAVGPLGGAARDWNLDGYAVAFGGGALFFVREAMSVDFGVTMTRGPLPNPRDDDSVFTQTGTLGLGVSWWP